MATVDVRCTLDRDPARYSLQEDVLLRVGLTNQGQAPMDTPFLPQNDDVTLRLKGPGPSQLRQTATRVPQPGVMKPSDIYPLAPGQTVDYALLLPTWFGLLTPGRYEVQLEIKSPTVTHTSPWLGFVVNTVVLGQPTVVPATAAGSSEQSLLWIDKAAEPPRLLCRTVDNGHATMTVALTRPSPTSHGLTAAMAPPDRWGARQWIVWAEDRELCYAVKEDRGLETVFRHAMDEAALPIGPALSAPDPDTDATGFSLLLQSSERPELMGLEVDAAGKVIATHRAVLDGTPEHVAIAYPAEDSRWIVWSQAEPDGSAVMQAMRWDAGPGFGDAVVIGKIPAPLWSLDAQVVDDRLQVAALAVTDDLNGLGEPRRTGQVVSVVCALSAGSAVPQAPVYTTVPVGREMTSARMTVSDNGSPWLLLRQPLGLRVLGLVAGELIAPFDIDGKSADAWLVVDGDEVPSVVTVDALVGWNVQVAVPDAGAH